MIHVAVVILNYRRADLTMLCLDDLALLQLPVISLSIIVVDNDSQDGSVDCIRQSAVPHQLLVSSHNGGYSAGNNLGIQAALQQPDTDYIWLLNNDTRPAPDALIALLAEVQNTGGIVGSYLQQADGAFLYVGGRIDWRRGQTAGLTEADYTATIPVDYVSGASMLISRAVIERVGLLDERYFLYAEDIEYCIRARKAGFPITVASASRVYHQQGQSTGGQANPSTQYYYYRNRYLLFATHSDSWQRVIQLGYTAIRLFKIWRRRRREPVRSQCHWLAWQDFRRGRFGPCRWSAKQLGA